MQGLNLQVMLSKLLLPILESEQFLAFGTHHLESTLLGY